MAAASGESVDKLWSFILLAWTIAEEGSNKSCLRVRMLSNVQRTNKSISATLAFELGSLKECLFSSSEAGVVY